MNSDETPILKAIEGAPRLSEEEANKFDRPWPYGGVPMKIGISSEMWIPEARTLPDGEWDQALFPRGIPYKALIGFCIEKAKEKTPDAEFRFVKYVRTKEMMP